MKLRGGTNIKAGKFAYVLKIKETRRLPPSPAHYLTIGILIISCIVYYQYISQDRSVREANVAIQLTPKTNLQVFFNIWCIWMPVGSQ